jgi:hypothetical protein
MKRLARIFLLVLTTALLAAACRKAQDDEPQLIIWLDIDTPATTKAEEGPVPAQGDEDAIKDLRIWVFLSETVNEDNPAGKLLGYVTPSNTNDPLTQYENRYHIPLDRAVAQAKPKVDIYVIGNPSTVGQESLNGSTSRSTLDGLTMSGNTFGVDTDGKPKCKTVPSSGLLYTGVEKNLSMTGSYPVMRVDVVKVRKAVAKFRFVFCQLRDEAGPMIKNLQITGLSLNGVDGDGHFLENGKNICNAEYLFNDSGNPCKVSGYREAAINFDVPTSIRRYAAPEEYVFNPPADPDLREAYLRQYEALINDGISSKKVLTEAGRCYLRETDKQLSGKVTYTYEDGDETRQQEATFTMHAPGDFARGRSWIVYVYFLRETMHFSVNWSDWAEGNEWSLTPIDPMRP